MAAAFDVQGDAAFGLVLILRTSSSPRRWTTALRSCGSAVSAVFHRPEPTPERTAFVRFRKILVTHRLDRSLFEAITGQLKARAIQVKTGHADMTPRSLRRPAKAMMTRIGPSTRQAGRAWMASRPCRRRTPTRRWWRRSPSRPPMWVATVACQSWCGRPGSLKVGHVVRCCRVSGFMIRLFTRRGPVWRSS